MGSSFRKIAVVGRPSDPRVLEPMTTLVEYLTRSGHEVLSAADLHQNVTRLDEQLLAQEADLIIAIGGDGTMLHAAALAQGYDVPLLGINRGRLGFLADVTPDEMISSLEHVLAGDYTCDSRLLLAAEVFTRDGARLTDIGLNDVVMQRKETGRMIEVETLIADGYVNTHAGDGLIVATPTGSTAYSLSCGGPILDPRLDALVIVPVAPHTLSDRPIVIPAGEAIDLRLNERNATKAEVVVDGRTLAEFLPGDRLTIKPAANRITLIHPPGYDFFTILRTKLYWGKDLRKHTAGDH